MEDRFRIAPVRIDMKLQLALDTIGFREAVELLKRVVEYIDWIEIGTPFIKRDGVGAIAEIRRLFPEKPVAADMKTVDGGGYEADMAFSAGASVMSVLGCASDSTIREALAVSRRFGGEIVADLLGVRSKLRRARELERLGVHYLGIHTGTDERAGGKDPLEDLRLLAGRTALPLVVAGGITPKNVDDFLPFSPAVLVVGSGIIGARSPVEATRAIRRRIDRVGEKCDFRRLGIESQGKSEARYPK
ncbi:MAG: 3-hexulose-6-phosphate synthase [bacterium]